MEHITNEQLNRKLDDHIVQHNRDNEAIMIQLKVINDIIAGAKFIPVVLKFLLLIGGSIGMLWALFKIIAK